MNNKKILLMGCSFSLSIGLVLALLFIHKNNQPMANGFLRELKHGIISPRNQFDLGYNSFYLAGVDSSFFYLGNYTSTNLLLKISDDFTDTTHLQIGFPRDVKLVWEALKIRVNFPKVYMMEGIAPEILQGTFPSLQGTRLKLGKAFFSVAIPLSSTSFILQAFDIRQQQYVLTKKVSGVPYDTYAPGILEPQGEGRFSVDGQLLYEPETARLAYLYYYRNQFITLDTSLTILYKAHTIDTISTAQIKVAKLVSATETKYTMSAPPLHVNKRACLSPDWVFVQSALKADNEAEKTFKANAIIDVYAMENGQYQFSFYLPHYKGEKLMNFKVYGTTLVAIFGQYICTYTLNLEKL